MHQTRSANPSALVTAPSPLCFERSGDQSILPFGSEQFLNERSFENESMNKGFFEGLSMLPCGSE